MGFAKDLLISLPTKSKFKICSPPSWRPWHLLRLVLPPPPHSLASVTLNAIFSYKAFVIIVAWMVDHGPSGDGLRSPREFSPSRTAPLGADPVSAASRRN